MQGFLPKRYFAQCVLMHESEEAGEMALGAKALITRATWAQLLESMWNSTRQHTSIIPARLMRNGRFRHKDSLEGILDNRVLTAAKATMAPASGGKKWVDFSKLSSDIHVCAVSPVHSTGRHMSYIRLPSPTHIYTDTRKIVTKSKVTY